MHPSHPEHTDRCPPGGDPRPAEPPPPVEASRLVAACEEAWRALQRHHPEIPDAVIVLGTGLERGRLVKLGHWWGGQWVVEEGRRAEVLLAGEALHLSPEAVFEVLIHEAAHGLNAARGVKDTSRGGRYHNGHFKTAAEALGVAVFRMKPNGWAFTELTPETRERYADTIAAIGAEMRLARHLPARSPSHDGANQENGAGVAGDADGGGKRTSGRAVSASCSCGRRMRMAPSVLAAGPVTCGRCGADFQAARQAEIAADPTAGTDRQPAAEASHPAAAVVDGSFMERRRQALAADDGQGGPFAEGLRHLEDWEAALVELVRRDGDAETRRMLEVFRERRPDVLDWLADLTTADIVPFPLDRRRPEDQSREPNIGAEPATAEQEIDLRTVELPRLRPEPPVPGRRREPPSPEVGA